MLVYMSVQLPHDVVSEMMDLIKSAGGTINEISVIPNGERKKRRKVRKPQKRCTKKLCRDVLDFKKKHPAYTATQIGSKFDISHGSVSRILKGTAAAMKPT